MNRQDAERIIAEHIKPIFGFALKRCKSLQDAEDLSQEIISKAFFALLNRDDIADTGKFIRTIAHHTLSNYYRDSRQNSTGIPLHEIEDFLCDDKTDLSSELIMRETSEKLQHEIAYLSKLQRQIIIAYYYENKKQNDIAQELSLPLGTVKWHLFEAKQELKRGMETMRTSSELKFNPIRFSLIGMSGSAGTKGSNQNFFHSALSQNIAYMTRNSAKTVSEIADALGVSPVYVESEAEYLEEYGFLLKSGERYLSNILIDEPTDRQNRLHEEMYEKAARLFANELFDELVSSGILDDVNIWGGRTEPFTLTYDPPKNKNFMLWSLIPYIAALSGEKQLENDKKISFEEAATLRPDGGHNICYASVLLTNARPPKYFEEMRHWCGPCWNHYNGMTLWQIDSEWSEDFIDEDYQRKARQDLLLLSRIDDENLTAEDYAYLAEKGYIFTYGSIEECFKVGPRSVWISDPQTQRKLLAIGDRIKEKYKAELDAFKAPYVKAVLDATPKHLHKTQKFVLQYIFYSDGWFLLYCLKELVNNGKLKPPSETEKKALTTVIFSE